MIVADRDHDLLGRTFKLKPADQADGDLGRRSVVCRPIIDAKGAIEAEDDDATFAMRRAILALGALGCSTPPDRPCSGNERQAFGLGQAWRSINTAEASAAGASLSERPAKWRCWPRHQQRR